VNVFVGGMTIDPIDRSLCCFVRSRVDFGGKLVRHLTVELIVDRIQILQILIEYGVDRLRFDIWT
jgi:hypothetical protein